MKAVLKALSVSVAVLFALGVVLATGDLFFFGSSKVQPLFGLSADALAGDGPLRDAGPDPSAPRPLDLDALARQPDAGPLRVR